MHDTKFNYHLIIFILKSFTNKHNEMTKIFPFVSVETCPCLFEKAFEWVPARAKSAKSVIMQFSLKSVLLGTNQIAGSANDFNMNMIRRVIDVSAANTTSAV